MTKRVFATSVCLILALGGFGQEADPSAAGDGEGAAVTNRPPVRRPDERSSLRLPPSVINIEDLSELELTREAGGAAGMPELSRPGRFTELDRPLRDSGAGLTNERSGRLPGGDGTIDGGRRGKGPLVGVSRVDLSYGSYGTLNGAFSSGQEFENLFYQFVYQRRRAEGFERDGERIGNSHSGMDRFFADFGWHRDGFELAADLDFHENVFGLQTNAQYIQQRTSGLALSLRGNLLVGDSLGLQGRVEYSHGRSTLEHATAPRSLANNSLSSDLVFAFSWPGRVFLDLGIAFHYEDYNDNDMDDSTFRLLSLSSRGGFGIGLLDLSVGLAIGLVDLERARFDYGFYVHFARGRALSLFAEVVREMLHPGFRGMLMDVPYAVYTPLAEPIQGLRLGGGFRIAFAPGLNLTARLHRIDYDTYYQIVPDGASGLYGYAPRELSLVSGRLELRAALAEALEFSAEYQWQSVDGTYLPYVPDHRLGLRLRYRFESTGTEAGLQADFEGSRNEGLLDPFLLLSLQARQRLGANVSLMLRLDNLFDVDYRLREAYRETGMTLHAGVHVEF